MEIFSAATMSLGVLFTQYPAAFIAIAGLLGLLVGSFLNVVIHRLPIMLQREWKEQCQELLEARAATTVAAEPYNLVVPRSRCPQCGHAISAWQNIPVLSYLWLRGRCAACRVGISARYPLIEIVSGATAAAIAWHFGFGAQTLTALLLLWTLIALTAIDLDHQLLPDNLTLPLLWLGLLVNSFGVFTDLQSAVFGAAAGYFSLWLIYHAFRLITGKEGMGFGDFKLFAAAGAWLGWQMLPLIILLASFVGAVIGIAVIVFRGRDRSLPIPFGPFLCGGIVIALFWGEQLVRLYLQFARAPI